MFHRLRSVGLCFALAALVCSSAYALNPGQRPRVLLLGDSNMLGFFGRHLSTELKQQGFDVVRRAKHGSGLAFPGFYDWFEKGPEYAVRHSADVVIVILGGNDGQSIKPRGPFDRRIRWQEHSDWRDEYRTRVREFAENMTDSGRRLVFLSPTNRRPRIEREKMRRIVAIQRDALEGVPRTWFVNTWALTSNDDGLFLAHGVDEAGRFHRYRKRDGIHLTEVGAINLKDELMPMLLDEVLIPTRRGR